MLLNLTRRCLTNLHQLAPSNSKFLGQRLSNEFFYSSNRQYAAVAATEGKIVSKEALMQLRKKTGYSISKCKEAIQKFGDDLQQAEEWLQNTARKEGWDKINKRANVDANQGLFGMIVANGFAAVVEVNCQTDFVARNEKFRSVVSQMSRGIFNDAIRNYRLENDDISTKWNLSFDRLSEKNLDFGSKLPDLLADTTGHLGEKISLGGAYIMRVAPDITFAGYVHPRSEQNIVDGVPTGHFVALVAFRAGKDSSEKSRAHLGAALCQHIIGMNPTGIGLPPEQESANKSQTTEQQTQMSQSTQQVDDSSKPKDINQEADEEEERESAYNAQQVTKLSNETTLLRQDFMLEPDMTVYDVLRQHDATIIDFVRLERGAVSNVHKKSE